jgi:hypothetical protein
MSREFNLRGVKLRNAGRLVVFSIGCCVVAQAALGATLAFPGAEGFGRYAKGGRGGKVIKVTTLDDSGPGSLRAAIDTEGPRIVVFEVAGIIALKSPLRIKNDFVTIAGQSAPGDGITLRDYPLAVSANEVVIRYLRARLGAEKHLESDAVSVGQGRNIVIDHCSVSWSNDETLSVTQKYKPGLKPLTDVTVQWSIISESLNNAGHQKGEHGYGSLITGSYGARFSFHHNLWAHHESRMPRVGNYAPATVDEQGVLVDFRNNVFYNWGPGATTDFYNWQPGLDRGYSMDPFYGRPDNSSRFAAGADLNTSANTHTNFVNNYYVQGANTGGPVAFYIRNARARTFFSGNFMDGKRMADQWSLVVSSMGEGFKAEREFPIEPVTTQSAQEAYESVLDSAGASKRRDSVDARVVDSVRQRTGRIINSQKDVGGWPQVSAAKPPVDTDGDGIPDRWERQHHLNPRNAADATTHRNPEGYSAIEEYLNRLP